MDVLVFMIKKFLRAMLVIFRVLLISLVVAAVLPFAIRAVVDVVFQSRSFTAESVPQRRVAIIFGARVYGSGRPSAMLADRIATGVDLYHAGKVDVLLMTGHRGEWEDEPAAMRLYALERGVPDSAIVMDGGGARTYDSCYRAKEVYGVTDAVVITQQFHLDRAMMLCSAMGIDTVGVPADYQRPWGYSRYSMTFSLVREIPALTLAVWELIQHPEIPALGDPTPIFSSDTPSMDAPNGS